MKKNLLRGTALTAAALLALSLTACGPAGDGDDASPLATQESASDAHMAQSTDPLQMLSHGSDDGFYLSLMDMTRGSEDRTELMGYIDYAQARAAVLCAQPNCTHSDESCPAWRGIWGGSAWVLPDGEHIVTNTGDEDSYTLTLCKPDGTVEKTLCRTADNNVPTLADSTWLYCVVAPGGSIVRVPLAGGDPEPLTSLNAYDVEGCLGREVLYPSYGSEEQADGTSRSTLKYTACNIDTGAARTLLEVSYPSGVISNPYLGEDTLYWYDPQGDTLVQVDVRTGSETRMPLEWEFGRGGCGEIYQTTISAQVEGKLIVDQYGEDGACRAVVDPADGTAAELTMGYVRNGHSEAVQILAQSSHGLLVKYENRMVTQDEVREDGTVGEMDIEKVRLALIAPEDFLTNQPNYRDITPVEGFDRTFPLSEIDALLPQADVVALALPHNADTAGLMDRRRLLLMKPDAVLLNAGRGSAVDCDALADVLSHGHLLGAGMDVTNPEPLPAGHSLWTVRQALITPHIAGAYNHMQLTLDSITALFLDNLNRWTAGQPLRSRMK